MSGDTLTIGVQSYWNTNSVTITNRSFNDVLTSIGNGLVNLTGGAHGNFSQITQSGSPVYTGLTSFLTNDDPAPPSGYPKAYLNWVFLDDEFNYVSSLSVSVAAASSTYPAATLNSVAPGSQLISTISAFNDLMRIMMGSGHMIMAQLTIMDQAGKVPSICGRDQTMQI